MVFIALGFGSVPERYVGEVRRCSVTAQAVNVPTGERERRSESIRSAPGEIDT